MDKYDYVIAKPEMEEVLYHAGFHKYIDKYLGKNGKWIYKYAGQAKNAVSGAVNKAKTMLPGLQKQATGAVSTARKAVSTGARTASAAKKQAQKRINAMLPILSKKFNSAKKKARSQAAGVKLVARNKTKNVKTFSKDTTKKIGRDIKEARRKIYNNVTSPIRLEAQYRARKLAEGTKKTVKKVKDKNLYQRTKHAVGRATGKYKSKGETHASSIVGSKMKGDSRYTIPYSRSGSLRTRGYNTSDTYDLLDGREIGRINDAINNGKRRAKANRFKATRKRKK